MIQWVCNGCGSAIFEEDDGKEEVTRQGGSEGCENCIVELERWCPKEVFRSHHAWLS